ncbi:MAG TPA: NAD(P)-dependent oxidoreductase [Stellaceae bacterium]|nr:NAD(P)-dependent oxidoreductase [Stellaceae bacterium]
MTEPSILVTGITGMIGHAVLRRLVAEGRRAVGLDRVALSDERIDCPIEIGDLGDPHRLHWVIERHGVDRLVHCGGISGPMLLRDNPYQVLETNVHGTMHVFEAARIHELRRVVFMSSIAAYGPQPADRPLAETAPLMAADAYGASKVCGEAILRAYAERHGVDGVALRVSAVYGPRRTTDCLIREIIRNGLAGKPAILPYGAGWRRQYVNVEDVVSAILLALDWPKLPQPAYNVTGGINPTLEEVAAVIAAQVPGARAEFGREEHPFDRPVGQLDIAAARRDLAYAPKVSLAEGVAAYAAWLKARG